MPPTHERSGETAPATLTGSERFLFANAEVHFMSETTKRGVRAFRDGPRRFLQERGIEIGASEPISVQQLCRNGNGAAGLNLIIVRKTCNLPGKPDVAIVFEI